MSDHPTQSPIPDPQSAVDANHLRLLADWFDMDDARQGRVGDEVQRDLRRIADRLAQMAQGNK